MKILFVIDAYKNPHAGTENQLFKLVQALVSAGHQPHLLVFSETPYIASGAFPCPVTVLGQRRLASPATWWALWRVAGRFRAEGYRLAHVFFNDPSLICPPVFAARGFNVLISRRDMGYWYTPLQKIWLRLNRHLLAGAVVNSEAVKAVTVAEERLPAERVHVIYNGYPLDDAVPPCCPPEIEHWRQPGDVLAVLVANIRPIKRIQDAVAALGALRERVPGLKLLLIGDGDAGELMAQARGLGVEARVRWLGPRTNPQDYVQHSDIGLLCSESEGFSNAIIEYMQCGKPVVCSRVGGNPEAVAHGEMGYLYEAGDVAALAQQLERLATSPADMARMGQLAGERVRERFSIDAMRAQHEALYHRLQR